MGRRWCVRRRRWPWRRLVSVVAAATLLLSAAAPLALASSRGGAALCCRDKCCCSGVKAGDGTCVRIACPCSRPSDGGVLADAPAQEALLAAAATLPRPSGSRVASPVCAADVLVGVATLPDPPPWPAVSDRAIS